MKNSTYGVRKESIIHELGHYACAITLGYETQIVFYKNSKSLFNEFTFFDDYFMMQFGTLISVNKHSLNLKSTLKNITILKSRKQYFNSPHERKKHQIILKSNPEKKKEFLEDKMVYLLGGPIASELTNNDPEALKDIIDIINCLAELHELNKGNPKELFNKLLIIQPKPFRCKGDIHAALLRIAKLEEKYYQRATDILDMVGGKSFLESKANELFQNLFV